MLYWYSGAIAVSVLNFIVSCSAGLDFWVLCGGKYWHWRIKTTIASTVVDQGRIRPEVGFDWLGQHFKFCLVL